MECIIDCSHFRSSILDYEIIREATTGYHRDSTRIMKLSPEDRNLYKTAGLDSWRTMPEPSEDEAEYLNYLAHDALEFLNEGSEDTRGYFFVENNSLYWDEWGDDDDECQGHPASEFDPMGVTTYCDGSCLPQVRKFN